MVGFLFCFLMRGLHVAQVGFELILVSTSQMQESQDTGFVFKALSLSPFFASVLFCFVFELGTYSIIQAGL